MKKILRLLTTYTTVIRNCYLVWLKYTCCILLALSSRLPGQAQMNFAQNQTPDFATQAMPIQSGFIITDPTIALNLSEGFEFRVLINTDILVAGTAYNIFTIGFYLPGENNPQVGQFCAVIKLALLDGDLVVFRVIDDPEQMFPLRLWKSNMVPENQGIRTIKFNIDSFATKIYNYDPTQGYSNAQVCELSFWGLLASEAGRTFEDPCWMGAVPAVLLPVYQNQFVSAHLFPFSRVITSPPSSNPVTGGTPASPQSKAAVQQSCSSCLADSLSPPKKKNIDRRLVKLPKMPRYLSTTAVVAKDKKKQTGLSSFKWNIYPNPTKDKITLEINSPDNLDAGIELTDQQGREVYTGNISLVKGINRQTISLRGLSLSAGIYFIRMRPAADGIMPEKELSRKIILQ